MLPDGERVFQGVEQDAALRDVGPQDAAQDDGAHRDEAQVCGEPAFQDAGQDEARGAELPDEAQAGGEPDHRDGDREEAEEAPLPHCEAVTVSQNRRQSDLPRNREMYVYPYSLTSLIKAGRMVC